MVAAEQRLRVIQGSLYALPFATGSFDIAWSMSTLVHVPDEHFGVAMANFMRVVRPGGMIVIGSWGGRDHEGLAERDHFEPPRFFSRRSHHRFSEMLARHGIVEQFETWAVERDGWDYQFAVVTRP